MISLLNSRQFAYDPAKRQFAAELSDLKATPFALEVGFEMQSARTGAVKAFRYHSCEYDREDEVVGWWYESADGLRAIIFND